MCTAWCNIIEYNRNFIVSKHRMVLVHTLRCWLLRSVYLTCMSTPENTQTEREVQQHSIRNGFYSFSAINHIVIIVNASRSTEMSLTTIPLSYESCGILNDEGPFLPQLPDIYAIHILQFLSPKQVLHLRQVSPSWNRACCSSSLWQHFLVAYHHNMLIKAPGLLERILDNGGSWMDVWKGFTRIEAAWKRGEFAVVNVIEKDQDLMTRCS